MRVVLRVYPCTYTAIAQSVSDKLYQLIILSLRDRLCIVLDVLCVAQFLAMLQKRLVNTRWCGWEKVEIYEVIILPTCLLPSTEGDQC